MKITYKGIVHERTEDAPFVGALICADACNFKCKGCFNKHLKKEPAMTAEHTEIIAEVKANPINQGVIFGGLEWSLQPLELLELIREAVANDLEIIIYTGCEFTEFQYRMGIECAKSLKFDLTIQDQLFAENDKSMFAIMGAMILDYYTPKGYYIKTGLYDKKNAGPKEVFGVTLSSTNQNLLHILGDDKEGKDGCKD